MTSERWLRIKSVLEEADCAAPPDRPGILDRLCGGDLHLRREVESFLQDAGSGAFIQEAIALGAAGMMAELAAHGTTTCYVGRRIGAYKLLELIGEGGMGAVYRGVRDDREFEQQVAIKFLHTGLGEGFEERFRRERQILARLGHPHIARILDGASTAEGVPYFVMEYIEGEPVTHYCRSRRLPSIACLELFIQICSAVDYANQKGLVHRDIKPGNILVTPEGIPKLLDFGIAKAVAPNQEREVTAPGMVIGSLDYLSPEQARGEMVDARSDVFSLGSVLYEALAGAAPFTRATTGDTLAAILLQDPLPLADIPRGLQTVVFKALRKRREERYGSAGELLAALKSTHLDLAARANPTWWRRYAVWTAATVGLAILSAWLALAIFWRRSPSLVHDLQVRQITSIGDLAGAGITYDGRYLASIRANSEIWIQHIATGASAQILPRSPAYWGLNASIDGNFVYYVKNTAVLYRIPILGGTPQKVLDEVHSRPGFSPDGKKLAVVALHEGRSQVLIADVDGGGARVVAGIDDKDGTVIVADWLPDGRHVVFAQYVDKSGWEIRSVPAEGGPTKVLLTPPVNRIFDIAVLPSGTLVLNATAGGGKKQIWLVRDGRVERLTNDLNEYREVHVTSRNEVQSVLVAGNRQLWAGAVEGPLRQISSGTRDYVGVNWTADSRIIANSQAGGKWELQTIAADGSDVRQLLISDMSIGVPSACKDGKTVLVSLETEDCQCVWRMDPDGGRRTRVSRDYAVSPACGADGREFFFLGGDSRHFRICRTSLAGGRPVCFDDAGDRHPLASPDGKWVAYGIDDYSNGARVIKAKLWPLDGGPPLILDAAPLMLDWTRESQALLFVSGDRTGGIWAQPINGTRPYLFTNSHVDGLTRIALSPDGKQIAAIRDVPTSDAVVFSGIR
jgi:eukaryotic-like serine/threonine-protein kinase